MHMLFAPLFSGSSGNSIYVGNEDGAVLVDAGMSATAIINEMLKNGLKPESVRALLITHEHTDHVQGAGVIARKLNVPIYATNGTWNGMRSRLGKLDPDKIRVLERGSDFYLDRLNVFAFETPHDTPESCGYSFTMGRLKATIATDVGCIKPEWLESAKGSDIVLLESNYDPGMLAAGPYPYELKVRIRGRRGHLSNDDAGKAACELVASGVKNVILGHLSKENNFPELALETCRGILYENGINPDTDLKLSVSRRDGCCGVYIIED